jgi:hypothetical protein
MKYTSCFLLMLFIVGCGSDLTGSRVRIRFQDGTETVYELLAVNDSALVVTSGSLTSPIHSMTVPFTDIKRVYHASSGSFEYGLLGAGAGCVGGLLLVSQGAGIGEGGGHPNLMPAFNVVVLTTAAGAVLGVVLHDGETAFYVTSEADLKRLKEFAVERR